MIKNNQTKTLVFYAISFILMASVMIMPFSKVSAATIITINTTNVLRQESSSLKFGWNVPPDNFNFWDDANWTVKNSIKTYMNEMRGQYYRYPGGTPANYFYWKGSIGNYGSRSSMYTGYNTWYTPKLGVDEALRFIESVGGEMIYVLKMSDLSDHTLSAQDCADLVEYLNGAVGSNPNGGTDWAQKRKDNGHEAPYNIKLFELGNELDWPQSNYTTTAYTSLSQAIMSAMLNVDNTIKFVGHARSSPWSATQWTNDWSNWNNPVMDKLNDYPQVIGMAFHPYYSQGGVDYMFNKWISELKTAMSPRISNGKVYITENAVWSDVVTDATSNMDGAVTTARFLLKSAMDPQIEMKIWHTFGKYRNNGRWASFETNDTPRPITEVFKVLYNHGLRGDIVQSTGSTATIQVIGSKDTGSGGYYRMSASNYEVTDQTLSVTMNGLSSGSKPAVLKIVKPNGTDYETEINYTQNINLTVSTGGLFSVVIPAKSVMVLMIPK